MSSLTHYYGRAKEGIAGINPRDMAQLGEDWLITAVAGAGVGVMSAALGGLDKQVAGFPVPLDGLVSVGLGVVGLQMGGDTGKALKIASIAVGGSAAVRTFEKFFEKGFGSKLFKAHGEFEDVGSFDSTPGYGALPGYGATGPVFAFGQGARDRLVEAARYL